MRAYVRRGVLLLLLLWPGAMLTLQLRFRVDPWKLMSFGMYSTAPRTSGAVRLSVLVRPPPDWVDETIEFGGEHWVQFLPQSAALQAATRDTLRNRQVFGDLVTPEALGRDILATVASTEAMLVLRELSIDPRTRHYVQRESTYRVSK